MPTGKNRIFTMPTQRKSPTLDQKALLFRFVQEKGPDFTRSQFEAVARQGRYLCYEPNHLCETLQDFERMALIEPAGASGVHVTEKGARLLKSYAKTLTKPDPRVYAQYAAIIKRFGEQFSLSSMDKLIKANLPMAQWYHVRHVIKNHLLVIEAAEAQGWLAATGSAAWRVTAQGSMGSPTV